MITKLFNIVRHNPGTNESFPLDLCLLADAHQNDKTLQKWKPNPKKSKHISDKSIFGTKVTAYKDLIWIPLKKRNHIIERYHNALLHAGTSKLIKTICTHFGWPGLQKDVENFVNRCDECQQLKIAGKKSYMKIPLQLSLHDKKPWQQLYKDSCGEWCVNFKAQSDQTHARTENPASHCL